jgi:hypothetical protein
MTLLLILAISIQPLQANGCDIDMDQSFGDVTQSHHMSMDGDSMHGHDTDRKAGQHNMPDCCDTEAVNDQQGCEHAMSCGNCYLSTSAISHLSRIVISWPVSYRPEIISGDILPSHDYPLFRPPIS